MEPDLNIAQMAADRGATACSPIRPQDIVVSQWVRMKCQFGCPHFGKGVACPPNLPSLPECRELFREYASAFLLRFEGRMERPEDRRAWTREINRSLLALERDVFLSGRPRALVFFVDPCNFCEPCAGARTTCRNPAQARPSPEGMGVDVFSTVRAAGMPIEVLTAKTDTMNRYALLLAE